MATLTRSGFQAAQPTATLQVPTYGYGIVGLNDHTTPLWTLFFHHVPARWLLDPAFYRDYLSDAAALLNLSPPNHDLAQRFASQPPDHWWLPNLDSVLVLDSVDLAPKRGGGGSRSSAIKKLIKRGGVVANRNSCDQELGTCGICLEELLSSSDWVELLRMDCDHLYHQHCILPWLQKRNTCPTCRREVGR